MALSQLQIAPAIVNGLFYGLLALVVGSGIIAIGFGGVQPMQQVWQNSLDKINDEAPRMKEAAAARKREFEQLASDAPPPTVTTPGRPTVQQRVARS